MRVEYDVPLPAGTGTIPHVVGTIGRSNGTDSVHGLAGAPSHLDAVVGGEYSDPNGANNNQPINRLPQAECYSPGPVPTQVFRFPTDTQAGTSSVPPVAVASVQCAPGPSLTMAGFDAGIGVPGTPSASFAPAVRSGAATAEGTAGPVKGHLVSDAAAEASGVDLLGGVIHVGSVRVHDHSDIDGLPGQAKSDGTVDISAMRVAGTSASLSSGQLTVAGQSAPVDSSAGQRLIDQLNAGLSPSGCKLSAIGTPSAYPQGFLLSRPAPNLGVEANGTSAASEIGGLLVLCNVPQSISSHAGGFSPERMQVVLGFAFTAVSTRSDPGGFGIDDLGGAAVPPTVGPIPATSPLAAAIGRPLMSVPTAVPTAEIPSAAPVTPVALAPPVARSVGSLASFFDPSLGPVARAVLFAGCLLGWCLLSVMALRSLRGVTAG